MFYAGARFVTTGHSYRIFDWAGATRLVDDAMAGNDLEGSLASH
jgi:4-hydroxyphenylacetate 3-monooxygenase